MFIMKKIQKMSDSEQEVMRLIWAASGSASSAEVLDGLKVINKEWKPNTVLTFLARLVEKGLLTAVKRGQTSIRLLSARPNTKGLKPGLF